MASLLLPHPSHSGVILRRSSRLLQSENVVAMSMESTAIQDANDHRIIQQREMTISMNMEDEFQDLNTSAIDNSMAPEMLPEEEVQMPQKRKKSKKRKHGKKKGKEVEVNQDNEDFVPVKGARKKRQPKPEPVYDIPDVERKETTFKGRLGRSHSTSGKVHALTSTQVMHV